MFEQLPCLCLVTLQCHAQQRTHDSWPGAEPSVHLAKGEYQERMEAGHCVSVFFPIADRWNCGVRHFVDTKTGVASASVFRK